MKISNLLVLTLLSLGTRFYLIHEPPCVVWDEVHFGKMAAYYINRTMFMDVHPPLGKMTIALAGYLTGFDGTYEFNKGGDQYITESKVVRYKGMRGFSALLGSMIVPLVYFGISSITKSKNCAVISSTLLLLDSGMITICQYILLDPYLLFSICGSVMFLLHFTSLQCVKNPRRCKSFTLQWWTSLIFSGFLLGCAMSVKWVGILTVVAVGVWTISDLWNIWKECPNPFVDFRNHFLARVIGLIATPLVVYLAAYYIHFKVLVNSGPGDNIYSPRFQSVLKGNPLNNLSCPLYIADGSIVTIQQNILSMSGYLHSHQKYYPRSVVRGNVQQVTLYYPNDENNKWVVEKQNATKKNHSELIEDNDVIKLRHLVTGNYLQTMRKQSPLTQRHQIVYARSGNENEERTLWKIMIPKRDDMDKGPKFHVVTTPFRLQSVQYDCFLHSNEKYLPEWANDQIEVTCSHHKKDVNNINWNFLHHSHMLLKNERINFTKQTFPEKFMESHMLQATTNSKLIPKAGEKYNKPWRWPLNIEGQKFAGSMENETRVYLLGTPAIWWSNCAMLVVFPPLYAILQIWSAHCVKTHEEQNLMQLNFLSNLLSIANYGKWFYIFWFIHYIPFHFMSRILYFHHYFPALIFSCCLSGVTVDILSKIFCFYVNRAHFKSLHLTDVSEFSMIFLLVILHNFVLYNPLTYGMVGPYANNETSPMYGLQILDSWEI